MLLVLVLLLWTVHRLLLKLLLLWVRWNSLLLLLLLLLCWHRVRGSKRLLLRRLLGGVICGAGLLLVVLKNAPLGHGLLRHMRTELLLLLPTNTNPLLLCLLRRYA
jgi:hypothetical protein